MFLLTTYLDLLNLIKFWFNIYSDESIKWINMKKITFEKYIKEIPDFPKPGIVFKDINPLLAAPEVFEELIQVMAQEVKKSGANKMVGLESRGFIFGIAIARELRLPFIPARKAGKLPGETIQVSYALEYGEQVLELQSNSINESDKVAIIDDLLATGGTASAAGHLVEKLRGDVVGYYFAIELEGLEGRKRLNSKKTHSVMIF